MARDQKILELAALGEVLKEHRAAGRKVIHCHGVFDLLHIGHIKHLGAAKALGDILVVTVTPDRFVNKGPHRPAFTDELRLDALAALSCVDYVALNQWSSAVKTIEVLKPDVYVKGKEKSTRGKRDHSDNFSLEQEAVEAIGGRLHLTEEDTFSASALINRHLDILSKEAKEFMQGFCVSYHAEELIGWLGELKSVKVLVLGEAIIDEYRFCQVMGKANKEPTLAARHLYTEKYAGGALAVANNLAKFCDSVGLFALMGAIDSHESFVRGNLDPRVHADFFVKAEMPTIVKTRFLDDSQDLKIFETYTMDNTNMTASEDAQLCDRVEKLLPAYDLIVVTDFGHGMLTPRLIQLLCDKAPFLAVNAQTNAGNMGFNMISKYPRADYICIDEAEARLETRSLNPDIGALIIDIAGRLKCDRMTVTRGKRGAACFGMDGLVEVPAFASRLVDRVGAGDAVLAITSPCVYRNMPMEAVAVIANAVGAQACSIMGNRESIDAEALFRYIDSLMK